MNSQILKGKNLDLLQEAEEQESEEANADTDVTAATNKLIKTTT